MSTAPVPRFVECIRVSSQGQADADTPEIQRLGLDKLRASRPGILVERVEELGVSGNAPLHQRPAIRRLRELTDAHAYDEVRCYAIDRLSRADDPADRMVIYSLATTAGAVIVDTRGSVIDPADESGMGEMSYYLQTFFAASERKTIARRTADGRRRAAAAGRYLGGTGAPFGYAWNKTAGKWEIQEERAAIVRRIFNESAAGRSTNEIRDDLNAEGIPTRQGGRWHQANICKLLRRRAYLGEWSYSAGGESYSIALPPIVDRDLFERVGLGLRARATRHSKTNTIEALIRGIATCGTCGRSMRVESIHNGGRRYAYYVCASQRGGNRCANESHRIDKVDPAVWAGVSGRIRDPELLREALDAAESPKSDGASWEAQVAACDARLRNLGGFEKEQMRLRRRGLVSAEAYEASLSEIAADRDTLVRTRAVAESGIAARGASKRVAQELSARLDALGAAIEGATFKDRRGLLEAFVPMMPGYGVTLSANGRIELRGALEAEPGVRHLYSPVSAKAAQ